MYGTVDQLTNSELNLIVAKKKRVELGSPTISINGKSLKRLYFKAG